MSVIGAVILPHPPVILPEVGRGNEKEIRATTEAYVKAAERVARWKPDVLIISSPHSACYADYFSVLPGKSARGSMASFGAPSLTFDLDFDADLRKEFLRRAQEIGLDAGTLGRRSELDHGVCVPLYFLRKAGVWCPAVVTGLSGFSPEDHYRLGRCTAEAAEALGRRAVFIASGDLSHRLKEDGPYGFSPEGPLFDRQVTEAAASADFLKFLRMDQDFADRAGECGLRSFQIMAGALDGLAVEPELLSYEGPFGVGYAVAVFTVSGKDESRRLDRVSEEMEKTLLDKVREGEDPYVRLARLSLETFVRTGRRLSALPDGLPGDMLERRAGAFVSLHKRGALRGCIGTIAATASNVALEIVRNAVSAGTEDPRFPPVRRSELSSLVYSVDVLGPAESVPGPECLDARRYGVIVSCGGRRGLLLPDLEGVDTPEEQIDIARRKGGIGADERYTLERFEVVRHT